MEKLSEQDERQCVSCKEFFSPIGPNQLYCSLKCKNQENKGNRDEYFKKPDVKFAKYEHDARLRGLSFSLSYKDFLSFWQQPCSYCGDEIETIGLDRIDNGDGYEINNVTPCCSICNRMKSSWSAPEFIYHIKKIAEHINE